MAVPGCMFDEMVQMRGEEGSPQDCALRILKKW